MNDIFAQGTHVLIPRSRLVWTVRTSDPRHSDVEVSRVKHAGRRETMWVSRNDLRLASAVTR